MNYITRTTDPFFGAFLDNFFGEDVSPREGSLAMRTDIVESKDNYLITIEIPGVKKENINLSLKDRYLTVTVTNKEEVKENAKELHYLRAERSYGVSSRSFYVGDATENDFNANYENGILSIEFAKKAFKHEEEVRKIEVK
ncbi:MAG: Hsp20/alpha crystallin family protein [Bacilli bacterium]|nr:Hsp20/alpha crystallin family protein [Bacilli bacterium]